MTYQTKYRIRALLLLLVFSLNTLAGFACSIGVDMGYNAHHHAHNHQHGKGKHHHHNVNLSTAQLKGVAEDCCAGEVTAFNKLDKSVVNSMSSPEVPQFLLAFTTSFFHPSFDLKTADASKSLFGHHHRSWRPLYDTDIRILVQSFQI